MDGLERELDDQMLIIRINLQESIGRDLSPVYGVEFTPTFIFIDAQGNELWRQVGGLDVERVRASVK